jgi:hypothetical protein
MAELKCLECDKYARWYVWYKGFSSPTEPPFAPINLAYNSLCDTHAIEELKNGRKGWQVECIRLIDDHFLPEGDRAKGGKSDL